MPDYRVEWKNGARTLEVELFDSWGYLNAYKFQDPNEIIPSEGDYTNQVDAVSQVPGWIMWGYDNKADYKVEHEGKGEVKDIADGSFPKGDFTWTIVKRLS